MRKIILLVAAVLLSGCVTIQKPIKMEKNYLHTGAKKIGVIFAELPKPNVHLPGAGCLLCIMVAEAANSTLSDHVDKLPTGEFKPVKSQFIKRLKAKGLKVIEINDAIKLEDLPDYEETKEGIADKDFRGFHNKYGVSHIMVIKINAIGVERKYSSYVAVSEPNAVVLGVGYLVNLKDNSYKWYKHIKVYKGASGNWDEPPSFPALTNAYYQALETGKEAILNAF